MKYNRQFHNRHSIRLKEFDYSQPGAYFFTAVTKERESLFGMISDGEMHLNKLGDIVQAAWMDLPNHYPYLELGTFMIMPNHVYGIVVLTVGAGLGPAPTVEPTPTPFRYGLPEIIRAFKSFSARWVNEYLGATGHSLWQRNYYEHVIRDQKEWERIHQYIESNPLQWEQDRENSTYQKQS
jgi:REP element-mobilizing transposase RayT